jgi:hypothetical protein
MRFRSLGETTLSFMFAQFPDEGVRGYVFMADTARPRRSRLRLQLSDGNDFGIGAELLVVAVGDVVFEVEVFQQGESRVNFYVDVLGQPDFVIDTRLLNDDSRAFVDAG